MSSSSFSGALVRTMNADVDVWNHTILNAAELDPDRKYRLYATGLADLSGRKYVALPVSDTPITPRTRHRYLLLDHA